MQCEICLRFASSRLPFNCTLCARDSLYQPRIQFAQLLLQKEAVEKEVGLTVADSTKSNRVTLSPGAKSSNLSPTYTVQRAVAEQVVSEESTQTVLVHVESLREETKNIRMEISARKARLLRRRTDLASAKQELAQSQTSAVQPVERGIKRTEHRWDLMHKKTTESRIFLSREAALLYGLHQRKRTKGGLGRDVYFIGGVPIADLRDLNNASPAQISTSNTNLAHLVHLVSHYLSVRLPAEIILSHSNYPLPTIFSPNSSYTCREVPFPGSTPTHSSPNSPSASRHTDQRPLPRPRPLHLDKKLSILVKDDQIAYASFVEGITFLAWDIAWLCKTQGLNVGGNSWEEVCAMGKNLWQLLLAPPARPPITREISSKDSPQKPALSLTPDVVPAADEAKDLPPLGHFSHNTAYGYLASAAGAEHMRNWRLQSPVKVIEKVKAMLLAERTGAEWEILEGNEWEEEEEAQADVRDVGGRGPGLGVEETGVLVPGGVRGGEGREEGKGTSGWMKLRSR